MTRSDGALNSDFPISLQNPITVLSIPVQFTAKRQRNCPLSTIPNPEAEYSKKNT